MPSLRRSLLGPLAGALTITLLPVPAPARAVTAIDCAALRSPIYEAFKPSNGTSLFTRDAGEVASAATYGFTENRGVAFLAAASSASSLTPIHRFEKAGQFAYVAAAKVDQFKAAGFLDRGVAFYAGDKSSWCTQAVTQFQVGDNFRYAAPSSSRFGTLASAATTSSLAFYGGFVPRYPATQTSSPLIMTPTTEFFSFATIPDTQQEVKSWSGDRFAHRSRWLLQHAKQYNLRWASQTGDLVDWDDATHSQYVSARRGLKPLIDAKMPAFINIGNHDAQATCVGGGACDPRYTRSLVRMTEVMNSHFSVKDYGVGVASFEPGKIDNTFARFYAGGRKWLVINLELWARTQVVSWAAAAVRKYSDHTVVISTHSFVSSSGSISTNAAYGSTSPRYLWDNLVAKYPNVRVVLSGHTGRGANFVKKGVKGNKVFLLLTTYHSLTTNPVRLTRFNIKDDTLTTWVYAPWTKTSPLKWVKYTGVKIVR